MSELGYLYILANSSMPGLVKVGKTTRSPEERALELSAATGLPTPFIVVYEQLFQDCGAAESFVHAYLAQKGHRVSDKREFFNAPANIVVRAICLAPDPIDADTSPVSLLNHEEKDQSAKPLHAKPWATVFQQAERHYHGREDFITDHTAALKLFKQAAKLGARPAFRYIAEIYKASKKRSFNRDNGQNSKTAAKLLEIYREGAYKGSAFCWWETGMILATGCIAWPRETSRRSSLSDTKINEADAEKCFHAFLEMVPNAVPDEDSLTSDELDVIYEECLHVFDSRGGLTLFPDSSWSMRKANRSLAKFVDRNSVPLRRCLDSLNKPALKAAGLEAEMRLKRSAEQARFQSSQGFTSNFQAAQQVKRIATMHEAPQKASEQWPTERRPPPIKPPVVKDRVKIEFNASRKWLHDEGIRKIAKS